MIFLRMMTVNESNSFPVHFYVRQQVRSELCAEDLPPTGVLAVSFFPSVFNPFKNLSISAVGVKKKLIAVGLSVTRQPPHRSRRAVFPHRALRKYSLPQQD